MDDQLAIPYSVVLPAQSHVPTASGRGSPRPNHPAPNRRSGVMLAGQARDLLTEAATWLDPDERFRLAHLAALRTAAALFADRARPGTRRGPINAWTLLAQIAPELIDWANYFASGASKRAAIEFGSRHVVTPREADDLVRGSNEFLALVEVVLGVVPSAQAS